MAHKLDPHGTLCFWDFFHLSTLFSDVHTNIIIGSPYNKNVTNSVVSNTSFVSLSTPWLCSILPDGRTEKWSFTTK